MPTGSTTGKPSFADLKRTGEHMMTAGDALPCYPAHIHRVHNVDQDISMSLYAYGRRINYGGRSEFNPAAKREKPFIVKIADAGPG